jgi:hypothetical protein
MQWRCDRNNLLDGIILFIVYDYNTIFGAIGKMCVDYNAPVPHEQKPSCHRTSSTYAVCCMHALLVLLMLYTCRMAPIDPDGSLPVDQC